MVGKSANRLRGVTIKTTTVKPVLLPPVLCPGDTIGICAPSGSFDPDVVHQAVTTIRSRGYRVFVPPDIFRNRRYLAGPDGLRASVLTRLFDMDEVRAVLCARGGFGALRVLPFLALEQLAGHPKWIAGFSDITALMVPLIERTGLCTLHGPVLTSLVSGEPAAWDDLFDALETPVGRNPLLGAPNGVTLRPGRAKGRLIGGNLVTLCHLCATPYQPVLADSILFLEEVNEPPYKIDRMLTQMGMAGLFQGVNGVVLGQFIRCGNPGELHEIVMEHFSGIPVFSGVPSGHGRRNRTFPMGISALMDAENRWVIHEA